MRLLIAAACGLLLAGAAFAEDKPAVVSATADKLAAAGVKAVIGVKVEPTPVQASAPVSIDDRVVVSPDDPPPPEKKAGKKARK
jgi:hypothetical protein